MIKVSGTVSGRTNQVRQAAWSAWRERASENLFPFHQPSAWLKGNGNESTAGQAESAYSNFSELKMYSSVGKTVYFPVHHWRRCELEAPKTCGDVFYRLANFCAAFRFVSSRNR